MRVLGRLRSAGFQKVAFSVKPDGVTSVDQAAPAEVPPAATDCARSPRPWRSRSAFGGGTRIRVGTRPSSSSRGQRSCPRSAAAPSPTSTPPGP